MENIITVIHILAAAGVIGLVLLQHGKGADMGASFGSGASGSLFGVSGSSNFMSRATAACVTIFFATSLLLAYLASHRTDNGSVVKLPTAIAVGVPATTQTNNTAAGSLKATATPAGASESVKAETTKSDTAK